MTRDLQTIRNALAGVLPGGDRITGIKAFSTGHSNETYLIEGLDQIVRLPPTADPLMPGSHDVMAQAAIYDLLSKAPNVPPVPPVLFQCDNPSVLGDPFFVMARVAGEEINDYEPQPWFADAMPAQRATMCQTWMNAFCQLAGMEPLGVLGDPMTPEAQAHRWRDMARQANCKRLVGQIDRLLTLPAPQSGAPAVVHGDPKLANLMWHDRELAAVLDWELAYNGEPLADLGYILFFFTSDHHPANRGCGYAGMWDRAQIIANWSNRTGRSTEGIEWHEIAAAAKMSAIIAYGHYLYVSGKSSDERFLRWKVPLDRNLILLDNMLASL